MKKLIPNGPMHKHPADANESALSMMEVLTERMKKQERTMESMKAEAPMIQVCRMNSIRRRAEEIVIADTINIY